MQTTPLKIVRERRGLSAEALAVAVGVRQPTINRIENGRKRPSPELAKRIAAYFRGSITRDQLMFPEEYDTAKKPGRAGLVKEAA